MPALKHLVAYNIHCANVSTKIPMQLLYTQRSDTISY